MKISREQLKKLIREEVDKLEENGLDEGLGKFFSSLGGQAATAAGKAASSVGQRIGQAATAVGDKVGKAATAVGGAVKTARQASAKADIAPIAQKSASSLQQAGTVLDGLVQRMQKLGMEAEAQPLLTALQSIQTAIQTVQQLSSAPAEE